VYIFTAQLTCPALSGQTNVGLAISTSATTNDSEMVSYPVANNTNSNNLTYTRIHSSTATFSMYLNMYTGGAAPTIAANGASLRYVRIADVKIRFS
jgi:hypothetical protein